MKFIHVADIHFDIPFKTLSDRADLGVTRRLEQRKAFKKMIEFAKENNVDCILISGDLYENEYIKRTTLDYINSLFMEIPNVKIYITPGNHDPILKNSYYNTYKFANNVKIFNSKFEKIETTSYNIYGYGFDNFEMANKLQNVNLDKSKINIFISHGDVYNESKYNYMPIKTLEQIGFDYIALGHIHKRDKYYPGSLISLGFDETGKHGFIYGEINKNSTTIENEQETTNQVGETYKQNNAILNFIQADERELVYKDFDISNITSEEELVEQLNQIETENNLYEINLIGNKSFEITLNVKLLQENIIKIKDSTKINNETNQINENNKTLSGFFAKNLNDKLAKKEITEAEYAEILELGKSMLTK